MKYVNLRAFEKHLHEADPKHLSPVYMILSKDDYTRKAATDALVNSLLKGQKNRELCVKLFYGSQSSTEEIIQELDTLNFFAPQKVIVINQAEKLIKEHDCFDPFFSQPPSATFLVFTAASIASNTNFFKKVEKAGIILDIPEEKSWEKEKSMQVWVQAIVSDAGKKLSPQAAQYLIKSVGFDQATLRQEIEKLLVYMGERSEIAVQDISKLCTTVNLESVWQLGEAVFKKDTISALRISKGILEEGTPLLSLLRQLRSQFQTEYQVSCILNNGGTSSDIAAQFPYMKGTILERHVQMAQNYGKKKFRQGILAIDDTELKAKNSFAGEETLNEILMIKLTKL